MMFFIDLYYNRLVVNYLSIICVSHISRLLIFLLCYFVTLKILRYKRMLCQLNKLFLKILELNLKFDITFVN